jgi:two-component system, NarL family, invasion response regulator UvrY
MARPNGPQSSPKTPIRVLLVDDHALVRAGIRRLLEDAGNVIVINESGNSQDAMQAARQERPDVVLMGMNGLCLAVLDGARRFQRQIPAAKIVVMSVDASMVIPDRLVQSGVQGCLTKNCTEVELLEALETVHRGERYISLQLARQLANKRLSTDPKSPFELLTHRELQVALLVTQGKSTTQIAKTLCLTGKTVNGYRSRIMDKLGVRTEVQLTHLALRHGVIELARGC